MSVPTMRDRVLGLGVGLNTSNPQLVADILGLDPVDVERVLSDPSFSPPSGGSVSSPLFSGLGPPTAGTFTYFDLGPVGSPNTSGDFKLQFPPGAGPLTAPIAWNATGDEVVAALAALPTIGAGNMAIYSGYGSSLVNDYLYLVFIGTFGFNPVATPMVVDDTTDNGVHTSDDTSGAPGVPADATHDGDRYFDLTALVEYILVLDVAPAEFLPAAPMLWGRGPSGGLIAVGARDARFDSLAEGNSSTALGSAAHAEGGGHASGDTSHAEGGGHASGDTSHAEGGGIAYGTQSHAEAGSLATGYRSHADSGALAHGDGSHADSGGRAAGSDCHADSGGIAYGMNNGWGGAGVAHAEGENSVALAQESHAEGIASVARGNCSHAQGYGTTALSFDADSSGYFAVGWRAGESAHSSGAFSDSSPTQVSRLTLGRETTDATPIALENAFGGEGAGGSVLLTPSTLSAITGTVAARSSDGSLCAMWAVEALIDSASPTPGSLLAAAPVSLPLSTKGTITGTPVTFPLTVASDSQMIGLQGHVVDDGGNPVTGTFTVATGTYADLAALEAALMAATPNDPEHLPLLDGYTVIDDGSGSLVIQSYSTFIKIVDQGGGLLAALGFTDGQTDTAQNTFWFGPACSGGTQIPEVFTLSGPGHYATLADVISALSFATGMLPAIDRFSDYVTVSDGGSGKIRLTCKSGNGMGGGSDAGTQITDPHNGATGCALLGFTDGSFAGGDNNSRIVASTITKTAGDAGTSGWDLALTTAVNGATLTATGEAATDIRWVASLTVTEVRVGQAAFH